MADTLSIPGFELRVNGLPLDAQTLGRISQVQVVDDLDALSVFTLTLAAWDTRSGRWAWSGEGPLPIGARVQVRMGNSGEVQTVLEGEVTERSLRLGAGQGPTLQVQGYSPLHRLERGVFDRVWEGTPLSMVVAEIAAAHGLASSVSDPRVADSRIASHRRTDLALLKSLAAEHGLDLYWDQGCVQLHPRPARAAALTLSPGRDLLSFTARMNARGQADVAVTHHRDADRRPAVLEVQWEGSDQAGPAVAASALGSASFDLGPRIHDDQDQARAAGEAALKAMADGFITATGTCRGRPDLRARVTVEIGGVMEPFAGRYLVTRATHTQAAGQSYQTSFSARRLST